VDSANRRIIEIKSRMMSNMATTLTLGLIKDSGLYVGHVGDSRAYIADAETGDIRQLTRDHKYVEDLVEQGVISREEAKTHPQRNIITSALGMDNLRIDILHFRNMFNENSRVIVCSDGLSDLVEDEEISLQAIRRAPPVEIAKSLIRLANERGGLDNISIAIDGYVF
jgi:protein phosphatase